MHVAPVDGAIARRQVFVGMPAVVVRVHVHHGMASHIDEASPPASEGGVAGVETHARARRQPTEQPGELVRMSANQVRERSFDGQDETDVCIGDVYRVGEAVAQVSQPRQPCWKLARRWRLKSLALTTQETGRTGWYFRVLATGLVAPGDSVELVERPNPEWTVARANWIMHWYKADLEAAAALAAVAELSANWKATQTKRATKGAEPDAARRSLLPRRDREQLRSPSLRPGAARRGRP